MKVNKKTMPSVAIKKEAKHAAQKEKKKNKKKNKNAANYLQLESKKPVPQEVSKNDDVKDLKTKAVSEQVGFLVLII